MSINAVQAPTSCPTCRSQDLVTPSTKSESDTYWRCRKCGDMWNVGRLRTQSEGYWRPFGHRDDAR